MTDAEKAPDAEKTYFEEKSALYAAAIFRNEYITTHKALYPEDKSFAESIVSPGGWWSSYPDHVGDAADNRWEKMTDEKKAPYYAKAKEVLEDNQKEQSVKEEKAARRRRRKVK
ncbi:unnamed protein product [Thlaspi arvense]|uniref:HMG box domain-containing protein n=1 Tax=Thlaspi arvense TaxID=13288 RepID=A0AAU9RE68_THLAR|nr:unnamed protein product [Thlaspi arvense]